MSVESDFAKKDPEKTCPNCRAKLTSAEWFEMCLRSTLMGGRFVRPCRRCGALLRLSISTYVAAISTLAAAMFYITDLVFGRWTVPPLLALAFATAGVIATLNMHLEIVPLEQGVREP